VALPGGDIGPVAQSLFCLRLCGRLDAVSSSSLLSSTPFEAAILDLDGTLVNTLGDFAEALNRMLAELKLPAIEAQRIEHMVGKGSEHLLRTVLAHVLGEGPTGAGQVESLYPAAWSSYQRHYLAINGSYSSLYPGVLAGLDGLLARGWRLACLTNKPLSFARPLLQAKGLDGYFSEVFGGDSFERKKPHPLPLQKTCAALRSDPGRTLMVGDSSNDAQAARAAACPVVLVTYGYNHGEPIRAVDADGFVDSLDQLGALLG
jgi:phosphoglycolate phosphatase